MLVKEDRVGGVCDIPPITHFDASWGPEPRGWGVQKVEQSWQGNLLYSDDTVKIIQKQRPATNQSPFIDWVKPVLDPGFSEVHELSTFFFYSSSCFFGNC